MNSKAFEIALALKGKLENSFMSSLSKAEKSVESCKKAFDTLAKQKVDLDKVFEARRSTLNASKAYFQAQKKVEDLQHALKTATSGQDKLKAELLKAVQSMHKAKSALDKQKEALVGVEKAAGTAGKSIKELQAQNEDLEKSIEKQIKLQKDLEKAEARKAKVESLQDRSNDLMLSGAGKVAGAVGMVTATLAKPVNDAISLENAQAELGKFSEKAQEVMLLNKELAKSYAVSIEDMVELQTNAMQSAIVDPNDLEGIKKYTEVASQAAIAIGMTGDEVGSAFATIQSQIAGNLDDTIKAFDLINQISNTTAAGGKDVIEVLSRTGGAVASLTSLATPQVVALAGAFTAASTSAEVAATAQASFINSLMAGAGATGTQKLGFDALGIDPEKLAKAMVSGSDVAVEAMNEVFAKINALADEDKSVVIGQIFGNEAGLKKAVATLAKQSDLFNIPIQLSFNEEEYKGSMFKEYETRSKTTENELKLLQNRIKILSASIGATLLPVINSITKKIEMLVDPIINWVEVNQDLVKNIGLVIASFAGVIAVIGAFQIALGLALKPFIMFYKVIGIATTIFKVFNLTLLANPITWIIAGIVALVAAGVMLYKNWDLVKEKAISLFNKLDSIFGGSLMALVNAFKDGAKDILNAFSNLKSSILNIISPLASTFVELFINIGKAIQAIISSSTFITIVKVMGVVLKNVLVFSINLVIVAFKALFTVISTVVKAVSSTIAFFVNLFAGQFNVIENTTIALDNVINTVIGAIINAFNSVIDFISSIFITSWTSALDSMRNTFSNAFNGLKDRALTPLNFILEKVSIVKNALGGAVDSVKSFFGFGDSDTQVSVNKAITTTASMPSVNVPALASGGITTGPTLAMIGEGAEQEAVMPLSRLKEFIGLTSSSSNTSNSETVVINFNPTINVNGSGDIESQISQAMQQAAVNVRQEIERYFSQRRRLAYD